MSFSYNPALPTNLDKVRFYLGDTSSTGALWTDEEITAALAAFGSDPYEAAARMAESKATSFSSALSISVEGLSIRREERASFFRTMASRIRAQGQSGGTLALGVTGVDRGEMASVENDSARPPSRFRPALEDYPVLPPELRSET